jgi:hypothetical protein
MLSKREEYIKKIFLPDNKKEGVEYLPEDEVNKIVLQISQVGQNLGYFGVNISKNADKNDKRKHKYDVWIAKEVKKNQSILNRIVDLRLIVDWAYETKADLFGYSFDEAFSVQAEWHISMLSKYKIEDLKIPQIDESRIAFRFSDKKHFLYILNAEELKFEGKIMGHCVGGTSYKQKIKNRLSIILSIRDIKNEPHVTIEIDIPSRMVIQQYGKGNLEPTKKYRNLIKEFLLFSTDYNHLNNKEMLKFLNLNFLSKK